MVSYLDDILIYSASEAEHITHVRAVLNVLRTNGLYAKIEKCAFHAQEVDFLGHIISHNCVKMDSARVDAVASWLAVCDNFRDTNRIKLFPTDSSPADFNLSKHSSISRSKFFDSSKLTIAFRTSSGLAADNEFSNRN